MYVLKMLDSYFDGVGFTASQRGAKRFGIERPTSTFLAYLSLLFGPDARFVKLTSRADRIDADIRAQYDGDYDNDYDPSTF